MDRNGHCLEMVTADEEGQDIRLLLPRGYREDYPRLIQSRSKRWLEETGRDASRFQCSDAYSIWLWWCLETALTCDMTMVPKANDYPLLLLHGPTFSGLRTQWQSYQLSLSCQHSTWNPFAHVWWPRSRGYHHLQWDLALLLLSLEGNMLFGQHISDDAMWMRHLIVCSFPSASDPLDKHQSLLLFYSLPFFGQAMAPDIIKMQLCKMTLFVLQQPRHVLTIIIFVDQALLALSIGTLLQNGSCNDVFFKVNKENGIYIFKRTYPIDHAYDSIGLVGLWSSHFQQPSIQITALITTSSNKIGGVDILRWYTIGFPLRLLYFAQLLSLSHVSLMDQGTNSNMD